ncbi:DUF411 domain-containing protein [Azohydromonas sp.]|uniref:DUF411 domain-containing protein n=1 Tax=Azohydromonas sp. TaxID=1872666 RepID=UPI002CA3F16F|nr:DUF411 domain-containing protein [Azohydromonas sp.]HMM85871.1 DUF411 domain-containing protein [Azohydromonas sp.]
MSARCTPPRRRFLLQGAALAVGTLPVVTAAAPLPTMQVWKSPTCGCCKDWIAILEREGLKVQTFDEGNTAARARLGLPMKYGSCHTALIGGYVVEGHVPVREIRRLLAEKPDAVGIAVPGMPLGSPGMDGPEYGGRRDAYDVVLVKRDGSATVWASYR